MGNFKLSGHREDGQDVKKYLSTVVLDWLHVVDFGVGADVLGNLFYMALTYKGDQLLAGRTKG